MCRMGSDADTAVEGLMFVGLSILDVRSLNEVSCSRLGAESVGGATIPLTYSTRAVCMYWW